MFAIDLIIKLQQSIPYSKIWYFYESFSWSIQFLLYIKFLGYRHCIFFSNTDYYNLSAEICYFYFWLFTHYTDLSSIFSSYRYLLLKAFFLSIFNKSLSYIILTEFIRDYILCFTSFYICKSLHYFWQILMTSKLHVPISYNYF